MIYRVFLGLKAYSLMANKPFTKMVILCEISNLTVTIREFKTVKWSLSCKKYWKLVWGKAKRANFAC